MHTRQTGRGGEGGADVYRKFAHAGSLSRGIRSLVANSINAGLFLSHSCFVFLFFSWIADPRLSRARLIMNEQRSALPMRFTSRIVDPTVICQIVVRRTDAAARKIAARNGDGTCRSLLETVIKAVRTSSLRGRICMHVARARACSPGPSDFSAPPGFLLVDLLS